jgi:addiction module HigA family antidote
MRPIHPGEILLEEFLKPLDMSATALAHAIGVPPNRVTSIVSGERSVTADTALRLSAALGTTAQFWMNLQQTFDLRSEEENKDHANERRGIRRLVPA